MRITCSILAASLVAFVALSAGPARADFLFVSESNGTIHKIDVATHNETVFNSGDGQSGFSGLAIDGSGHLYAAFATSILKFNSAGVSTVFATGRTNGTTGLAFDTAGNLYAASSIDGTIVKYDTIGSGTTFANTGLNRPVGLTFDTAGNLYAANFGNSTIEKFTTGGSGSVFANSGLTNPFGLTFDNLGNLYAANDNGHTIEKFNSNGVGTLFAGPLFGTNPLGLASDASGNIFASLNALQNTIAKYAPDGSVSVFAAQSSTPTYLAYQLTSVPEPSAFLLMGIGGLIVFARTRRRSVARA
jgi:sugar lactone lactonase YvrE